MKTEMTNSNSKYSGITLMSLFQMVSLQIPLEKEKLSEVWEEILYRYFKQGRKFDLYSSMRIRNSSHFLTVFFLTLHHELESSDNIPEAHIRSFNEAMESFIEDTKELLTKENMNPEEQNIALSRIIEVLEALKDKKVIGSVYANSRQGIISLIERLSIKIEENNKLIKNATALVIVKQRSNEPKKIDVALYKLKKDNLMEMLNQAMEYSEEDRIRLIRFCMKKYPEEAISLYPDIVFVENVELKYCINMTKLLRKVIENDDCYARFIKKVSANNTLEEALEYIKNWYLSVGGTGDRAEMLIDSLVACRDNHVLKAKLVKLMKDNEYILNQYENKSLHCLLKDKQTILVPKKDLKYVQFISYPCPTFAYGNIKGTPYEEELISVDICILEYYFYIMKKLMHKRDSNKKIKNGANIGVLFYYDENNRLHYSYEFSEEELILIRKYIQFPCTIKIDMESLEHLKGMMKYTDSDNAIQYSIYKLRDYLIKEDNIEKYLELKLNYALSKEEVELIYADASRCNLFISMNSDIAYKYFYKYFNSIVELFDFSNQEDLKQLFNIQNDISQICCNEGYKNKAVYLYKKLKDNCPHLMKVIEEYLPSIDLSSLQIYNKGNYNKVPTMELLRIKLILEFFQNEYRIDNVKRYIVL